MIFESTPIDGVLLIKPERFEDARGSFARVGCLEEFAAAGIHTTTKQSSVSQNHRKGTLRGIHFQRSPWEEAKLVRCERGSIFDVAVDLRTGSKTFGQWYGAELSQQNMHTLYLPEGLGHAFQTLMDDSQVLYHISEKYVPDSGAGLRYDDADLAIDWPLDVSVISEKDLQWPTFRDFQAADSGSVGAARDE